MMTTYEKYVGECDVTKPNGNAMFWIGVKEGVSTPIPVSRRSTECFSAMPVLFAGTTPVFVCDGVPYVIPDEEMRFVSGLDESFVPKTPAGHVSGQNDVPKCPDNAKASAFGRPDVPEGYSCEQMPLPKAPKIPQRIQRSKEDLLNELLDGIRAYETGNYAEYVKKTRGYARHVHPRDVVAGMQLNLFHEEPYEEDFAHKEQKTAKKCRNAPARQENLAQAYIASVAEA